MLNFKQFVLQDARSNLELNPKVSINQRLKDYYNRAPKAPPNFGLKKNAFVSFTTLEKLGVNPDTKHETPLAICAYSLEYVIRKMRDNSPAGYSLPYAGNAPYANCFSVKGNIINISKLEDFSGYHKKLIDFCRDQLGMDKKLITNIWVDAKDDAKSNHPGKIFWNTIRFVAWNAGAKRNSFTIRSVEDIHKKSKSRAIIWNHLLRSLGIDGLIDNGKGILHPNEKSQQMFLHMGCIYNIERYDNKWSPDTMPLTDTEKRDEFIKNKRYHFMMREKMLRLFGNAAEFTKFPNFNDPNDYASKSSVIQIDFNVIPEKAFLSIMDKEFGNHSLGGKSLYLSGEERQQHQLEF